MGSGWRRLNRTIFSANSRLSQKLANSADTSAVLLVT
jgi:hypothetical protein